MKIITIRDEELYRRNTWNYFLTYYAAAIFFGAGVVSVGQGNLFQTTLAFLLQLLFSVSWFIYSLERNKLIEVKTI